MTFWQKKKCGSSFIIMFLFFFWWFDICPSLLCFTLTSVTLSLILIILMLSPVQSCTKSPLFSPSFPQYTHLLKWILALSTSHWPFYSALWRLFIYWYTIAPIIYVAINSVESDPHHRTPWHKTPCVKQHIKIHFCTFKNRSVKLNLYVWLGR